MDEFQRQTAYKVRVGDLINNEYIRQSGEWEPNYITVNGLKVSRANIIASVIDKQESDLMSSISVDDGSGNINVRCFNELTVLLKDIQVGDLVLVIGRPRENNGQIFVAGEIVKKLSDPSWSKLRKLELGEFKGNGVSVEKENVKKKVLDIINELDEGEGADVDQVILKSGLGESDMEGILKDFLEQGEIYEPKPGRVKSIE